MVFGTSFLFCVLYSDKGTKTAAWPKSYQIGTGDRRTPETLQVEMSVSNTDTNDKHEIILSKGLCYIVLIAIKHPH